MENHPKYIVIHCTDAPRSNSGSQFLAVNRYHQQQSFPKSSLGYYGGYHVFIDVDGSELRYRNDNEEGAHTNQKIDGVSVNLQSLAVCLAGDFDNEFPSEAQVDALCARLKKWMNQYHIDFEAVRFHRQFNTAKTCPGANLSAVWLVSALDALPGVKPPEQMEKRLTIRELNKILDGLRATLIRLQQQFREKVASNS